MATPLFHPLRKRVVLLGIFLALAGRVGSGQDGAPVASVAPGGDGFQFEPSWPAGGVAPEFHGAVSALDVDRSGQIWVVSRSTVPVRVYDAKGQFVRSWGGGVFQKPHGLGFDAEGRAWITDIGDHTVRQFTPEGELLRTLGTPGEAGVDETHFNQPTDVAVGPDGSVYVSDGYGNNRVVRFDPSGRFQAAFGSLGTGPGQFRLPHALAFDGAGRLYVADRSNGRIQVFDASGRFLAEWADVLMPWDIWISPGGRIFVCGSSPMRRTGLGLKLLPPGIPPRDQIVVEFNAAGQVQARWMFPQGTKPGALDWVHGLTCTPDGALYLGDIQGERAQKFNFIQRKRSIDAGVERAANDPDRRAPTPRPD
jgi:streptogramin lyase